MRWSARVALTVTAAAAVLSACSDGSSTPAVDPLTFPDSTASLGPAPSGYVGVRYVSVLRFTGLSCDQSAVASGSDLNEVVAESPPDLSAAMFGLYDAESGDVEIASAAGDGDITALITAYPTRVALDRLAAARIPAIRRTGASGSPRR